jgi:hypothetical protein
VVYLDNQFLDERRTEGVFLDLDRLVDRAVEPAKVLSTSKVLRAAPRLRERLGEAAWQDEPRAIGAQLSPDLFSFRRPQAADIEEHDILEMALLPAMPTLVTSANPALDAARFVTQVEFDRCYRSILRETAYRNKNRSSSPASISMSHRAKAFHFR